MSVTNTAGYLHVLFAKYNEEIFHGKLTVPVIRVDGRYKRVDGMFTYSWSGRNNRHVKGSTMKITIARHAADEVPCGTLIHEMIHQYQVEILGRDASHDAIFTSIARKCERVYKVGVR